MKFKVKLFLRLLGIILLVVFIVMGAIYTHLHAEEYYIEKHNETLIDGKPIAGTSVIKMWVSDDAVRYVNSNDKNNVLIIHMDKERIYQVNDVEKTVQEKELRPQEPTEEEEVNVTSKRTNEEKKVGKWDTYQVLLTSSAKGISSNVEFWLCKDLELSLISRMRLTKYFGGRKVLEELKKYPGYPVEMIVHLKVEGKNIDMVTSLVELEKKGVDKKIFDIPPDYKKIDVPASEKVTNALPGL